MLLSKRLDNNVRQYCNEIYTELRTRFPKKAKKDFSIRDFPAMASACCFRNTCIVHDCSKSSKKCSFDKRIENQFNALGGEAGDVVNGCKNQLGRCSEQQSANLLLNKTRYISSCYPLRKIIFSKAYRPRTMTVHPMCVNCRLIFK